MEAEDEKYVEELRFFPSAVKQGEEEVAASEWRTLVEPKNFRGKVWTGF